MIFSLFIKITQNRRVYLLIKSVTNTWIHRANQKQQKMIIVHYLFHSGICLSIKIASRGRQRTNRKLLGPFFFLRIKWRVNRELLRRKACMNGGRCRDGIVSVCVCVFMRLRAPPACTPCQRDHNKLSSVQPGAKVPCWCWDTNWCFASEGSCSGNIFS